MLSTHALLCIAVFVLPLLAGALVVLFLRAVNRLVLMDSEPDEHCDFSGRGG